MQGEAIESLEKIQRFVNSECEKAIHWYYAKKRPKKICGYLFRAGAIIAIAISGVIPVFSEMLENDSGTRLSPAWATIALAVALLFIALDRFGGYTSGWIRYIRAGQILSQLQSDFRVSWETLRMSMQRKPADTEEHLRQGIDLCQKFLAQVNETVRAETDQWSQDFQSFLLELEATAKKRFGDEA
jgi:hypothetical protein